MYKKCKRGACMDTFDNVVKTTKDIAETVGKKGEELLTISKLKIKETQIKRDISVKLEKLGKMYYELTKAGEENKLIFKEIIEEIDELRSELSEVRGMIGEIKGVENCPVCGAKNPMDAEFCIKCGEKM